jgi:hypothetical protein
MNKDEVHNIIEATLKSGARTPGLFDIPKMLLIKAEIQSCTSISDVLWIIEKHRNLISKAFGLRDDVLEESMQKLKALES